MILKDIMQSDTLERADFKFKLQSNVKISELISQKDNFEFEGKIAILDEDELVGYMEGEMLGFLTKKIGTVRLDSIMGYVDEGIIIIDADGRIFYINDAYSKIIGVPKRKIVGKYIQEIEADSLLVKALRKQKEVVNPKVYIKSVKKNVSVKIHPFYIDSQFAGMFSIFKDVTTLTNLNREVSQISGIADIYKRKIERLEQKSEEGIVGESPKFVEAINKAFAVAPTDATTLICGENGSGKEIIAKLIHKNSSRKDKPMITINCAAIPEALIESELFGYEEGTFTGANKGGKIGKFEMAHKGTLFLDEIGEMPLHMQAKILRVLQNGEIEKIGGGVNTPVDVRIIAATNQPLEDMIENNTFRQDLYYRLNVVRINMPPLRDRGRDVVLLAHHFLERYNKKYQKNVIFSEEANVRIKNYSWPGNVREMQNVIESAVIMCNGGIISEKLFPKINNEMVSIDGDEKYVDRNYGEIGLKTRLQLIEKEIIENTLIECGGNRANAMKKLELNERTFYRLTM